MNYNSPLGCIGHYKGNDNERFICSSHKLCFKECKLTARNLVDIYLESYRFYVNSQSCQIMTYLCLAATASALQGALFAKLGEPTLQWMKVCTMYGKFCNQVGEGIASAVIASLSMVVLSAISAFSLFRLYGDNKDKNNGRW